MFEYFRKRQNTYFKILSILLAILLWFFVLSETNPVSTEYITVPITFLNVDSVYAQGLGFVSDDFAKEISVTVQGRRDELNKISDKDFAATVDYSSISGKGAKLLEVTLTKQPAGIEVKKISPQSVRVAFDTVEDRTFTVNVVQQGTPTAGYKITRSYPITDSILINSLSETINSISRVSVYIDAAGIDRDVTVRKACRIFDLNGNEILEMKDRYFVDVKVEVAKEVAVVPDFSGEKPAGVSDYTYEVSPSTVWVTGPGDVLSSLTGIMTEKVDLAGIGENTTKSAALLLPQGVSLYQSPDTAQITFSLTKTGTVTVKVPDTSIKVISDPSSTLIYTMLTKEVSVDVTGKLTDIEGLTAAALEPSVNITGLREGLYNLQLTLKLPSGTEAKTSYFVEISITNPTTTQ